MSSAPSQRNGARLLNEERKGTAPSSRCSAKFVLRVCPRWAPVKTVKCPLITSSRAHAATLFNRGVTFRTRNANLPAQPFYLNPAAKVDGNGPGLLSLLLSGQLSVSAFLNGFLRYLARPVSRASQTSGVRWREIRTGTAGRPFCDCIPWSASRAALGSIALLLSPYRVTFLQ